MVFQRLIYFISHAKDVYFFVYFGLFLIFCYDQGASSMLSPVTINILRSPLLVLWCNTEFVSTSDKHLPFQNFSATVYPAKGSLKVVGVMKSVISYPQVMNMYVCCLFLSFYIFLICFCPWSSRAVDLFIFRNFLK